MSLQYQDMCCEGTESNPIGLTILRQEASLTLSSGLKCIVGN